MEDEEIKVLLRRNLELARENNKLLKKIRRSGMIANVMRIIWWGVFLGVPVFLYYYVLQPYLAELSIAYNGLQNSVTGAGDVITNTPLIGDLLEKLGGVEATEVPEVSAE